MTGEFIIRRRKAAAARLTFNNDVVVKLADGTVVDAANYTVTVSPADGHLQYRFNPRYLFL